MHTLTPLHDPLPPQENQLAVVDCLEDPDDTQKRQTQELQYTMPKANTGAVGGEEGVVVWGGWLGASRLYAPPRRGRKGA